MTLGEQALHPVGIVFDGAVDKGLKGGALDQGVPLLLEFLDGYGSLERALFVALGVCGKARSEDAGVEVAFVVVAERLKGAALHRLLDGFDGLQHLRVNFIIRRHGQFPFCGVLGKDCFVGNSGILLCFVNSITDRAYKTVTKSLKKGNGTNFFIGTLHEHGREEETDA